MQSFTADRNAASADEIWLTEHEPVYTLGLAGRREHLLRDNGIPLVKVDRGGQITYHGPGQLVVYVLIDLARRKLGVRALVRALESCVIEFLETCGVCAHTRAGAPGVYVSRPAGEAKIAALGLKIKNGCSYHGLALNIDMDLTPFADIDPCGYPGLAVTQLKDLGVRRSVEDVGSVLAPILASSLPARSS
jgi:lipoyl(octanoyl) transferase